MPLRCPVVRPNNVLSSYNEMRIMICSRVDMSLNRFATTSFSIFNHFATCTVCLLNKYLKLSEEHKL
jgi:hypothetical protein